MASRKRPTLSSDIAAVLERIQHWRQTRERPGRMPEELWAEAVDLARSHGIGAIARALRIDYYCLKRRLEEAGAATDGGRHDSPAFVEVDVIPALGESECVVELEEPGGSKMILRQRGSVDVMALAGAFWRRGR